MKNKEYVQILVGIMVLFIVAGIGAILNYNLMAILQVMLFSIVAIVVPIIVRKTFANALDANVEHKIWHFQRFGWKPSAHFSNALPFGIILPLIISLFGILNGTMFFVFTIMTYETSALKRRAAKRFGHYSYTQMTDWHNGLIGAVGIISILLISMISYLLGFEYFAKISAYYAFWNMVPFSSLDGTHIFFGNRILYFTLGIFTLIFAIYALLL